MMRRALLTLAVIALLGTSFLAAIAAARGGPSAVKTLTLQRTIRGKLVANGHGFTLYMFTRDHRRQDRCVKISGCAAVWPPATVRGQVRLGPGLRRALVGTIPLGGGKRQLTYSGRPLYTYVGDGGPGATSYIGVSQFGGFWYALRAGGGLVR